MNAQQIAYLEKFGSRMTVNKTERVLYGHDIAAIQNGLQAVPAVREKPAIIIAHTVKGKGVSFVEADYTFHGRALTAEQAVKAREEILCR